MTENNAKQTGPWWHWGILAILFLAGGIQWIIDPPVSGVASRGCGVTVEIVR